MCRLMGVILCYIARSSSFWMYITYIGILVFFLLYCINVYITDVACSVSPHVVVVRLRHLRDAKCLI